MARNRKTEVDFSWTDDKLQLLLETSLDFKSNCELQGEVGDQKDLNMKIFWILC